MSKRKFSSFLFISSSRRGFTLAEVVVAIGIFSIVIGVAVGGFVQSLRAQRQAAAIAAANDNVFLALEQMAREMRTGRIFCSSRATGSTLGTNCLNGGLTFISGTTNETIEYCLSGTAIHRSANGTCGSANSRPITGSNVSVAYLVFRFYGQDEADGLQPRITISLGIRPSAIGSAFLSPIRIQTTVSSRYPDS